MTDINTTINNIRQQYQNADWFYDAEADPYGRIVVYVHKMSAAINNAVPEQIDNRRVMLSFAAAKTIKREQWMSTPKFLVPPAAPLPVVMEEPEYEDEDELPSLSEELIALEKICGLNVLRSVFYELHDGARATTNLSRRYPEVREGLEELYEVFGFDLLHDALNR